MWKKLRLPVIIFILIVLADQILKIWVKTHMVLGESSYVDWDTKLKWAQLVFVENNGMAFGMELPATVGKLLLSIFRIIFVIVLSFYLVKLAKKGYPRGFLITFSLIIAGALGNLIDSMFYGLIFDASSYSDTIPAAFTSFGEGYAPFLQGKVVDMFYFPLFTIDFPQAIPMVGGKSFLFFEPVFNIADSAITVAAFMMILFFNKWTKKANS